MTNNLIDDKPENPPAFPYRQFSHQIQCDGEKQVIKPFPISDAPGMTMRDYFAASTLQGWAAHGLACNYQNMADECYAIADAMLKARVK